MNKLEGHQSDTGKRFALYREDDNGARFLIAEFAARPEAEERAAELAYGGHKQHYFIDETQEERTPLDMRS